MSIESEVELVNLLNQRRCRRRFRTNMSFERPGAVSPIFHSRFDSLQVSITTNLLNFFLPFGNPIEVVCSNGLPGVEANGVCCEAQCGTCGGSGCGGRPGGRVRWFLVIFVSYPLLSSALGEACSFVCRGLRRHPGPNQPFA